MFSLRSRSRSALSYFAGLAFLFACSATVFAQQQQLPQPVAGNSLTFKVKAAAERLEMTVNTSRIMEMPYKVPRLFVANPDIVRATPLSPNQVQLSALKPGVTQVNVWDEEERIATVDVIVYGDARELEMLLRGEFPDAQLKIRPLASSVYISGFVPKAEQVGQIVRMAEDYYPKVVNNLTVGGVQQILLNVKIMEISRTKLRAMGVDWSTINGNFFMTQRTGNLISNIDTNTGLPIRLAQGAGSDTLRFGIINGADQFYGFLELLRANDLAKLLAEPKLTTVSGRPATFNVGGQVPIPVAQSLGQTTVQYKDFGTQVDFVPVALGNGSIRLEVRPDITEVDPSLRDATTGVPGFRRRFADTAVELKAGQTMAIAGLIYYRTDASVRGLPWLSDLPWVGAAFRRTRETINEVELVITVTPEFVDAMDPEEVPPCGPGMRTTNPTDAELYWRGYIEVPKCCKDGSCDECRSNPNVNQGAPNVAPAGYPAPGSEEVTASPVMSGVRRPAPQRTQAPAAAPVVQRSQPSNTIPTNAKSGSPRNASYSYGANPPRSPAPVKTADPSEEPSLIGPLGYDPVR